MFDLSGDVAIVTGGNGGIGLAYAKGLVKCGSKVAIWGRNPEKNKSAVAELEALGGEAKAYLCDVTSEEQVASAFAETIEQFGKVDSCFANAGGGGKPGLAHKIGREAWDFAIDLNVMSVINTWAPVIDHMVERKQGGRLVVTSSVSAVLALGGGAAYGTTKAAVCALARAMSLELGHAGIRVNAILPGFIETEMSLNTSKQFQETARRRSAIGRIGTLEDMEGIAAFLAAKESDYITGQSIIMDGGFATHPG